MIHVRAITVVILLLAALAYPLYKYSGYLSQGMRPSDSTLVLDEMERNGVPNFTLQDLKAQKVSLSDFKDSVVIVNFWASWCAPCVKEFPSLKNLVERMRGKVKVLAISHDNTRSDVETFIKVFGDLPKDFIILWDQDRQVSKIYGTQVLPESYIIGPNRKLIRKVAGIDQWDSKYALKFFEDITAR